MTEDKDETVFKNLRYYIIGSLDEKIEKILIDGKAKEETYLSGLATHAVVTDYANLEVEEAKDVWQIPTVTTKWVELSNQCQKLLPPAAFTPSNSQLFSGLVLCPSQMVRSDIDVLWALCTYYGGEYKLHLDNSCTHLITPKPCGKKYEEALKLLDKITIITPDWIMDSLKSNSLQDVKKYHPNLVIVPEQSTPQNKAAASKIDNDKDSEIIASSLENIGVSTGNGSENLTAVIPSNTTELKDQLKMTSPQVPSALHTTISQSSINTSLGLTMQSGPLATAAIEPGKMQFCSAGQTIMSQSNSQVTTMQQQMNLQQQYRIQTPIGVAASRFPVPAMPQRFPIASPAPATNKASQKKPATKRRRSSSSRAKNASNTSTSTTIPSSPVHANQMNAVMISPQQMRVGVLQPNQQMINQQRMMMMGQAGQTNFMQQQMIQQQHVMRMQGKGPVTPTSPQKLAGQHMMGDQQTGVRVMRPGFPNNFANNAMRMQQQQQQRPMQNPSQLSPQQMMTIGFNSPMQQVQQNKMNASVMQQQFLQQPGMTIPMNMNQQGQQVGVKIQSQHLPVSPQQHALYVHQHGMKQPGTNMSPRHPMQQQTLMSPSQQQQIMQQQSQQEMTPQQRQQFMQMVMQQQQQQQQLQAQQQQQMRQNPNIQGAKHTMGTSHTAANTSVDVISPTALQQGLILAQQQQGQVFQQPLIHPSLQTPPQEFTGKAQQGGSKSRRSKARKTKDGDENSEGKTKSRSRGGRQKKSSQSPASVSSSPKKLLHSPNAGTVGKNVFSPMIRPSNIGGYYPATMNVMTPPPHPTVPVVFSSNKHPFPSTTCSPLAATENTATALPVNTGNSVPRPSQPAVVTKTEETHFLVPYKSTTTPPPPHRGPFIDPLTLMPNSYEGQYFGHDPAENVPKNLCLLGCVFVIFEYQDNVPDVKVVENWKKIIGRFGGIVEDDYNSCTCTHILCVSQGPPLFREALLEGKRCVTVYWLNDILQIRKLQPPWMALHIPTPFPPSRKPATNHVICYTGFHQKERERIKMMVCVCGAKFTRILSRSNTILICKGTLSLKYDKAREWKIPCVNVYWLRDILHGDEVALNNPNQPKYQNFDEEIKDLFNLDELKAQQILDPWKVPVRVTLDCMHRARVKRKNSAADNSAPVLKRSRIEGFYQPLPRVCFTGLPQNQVAQLQKSLESLQGQIPESVSQSTHLVANKVSRTAKFLCAISVCQYIVTPQWIEDSAKSNWQLDEEKYLLTDTAAEQKFQFSLKESISKAREKQLFKGYKFILTNGVVPDRQTLAEIIECAGGRVLDKTPSILTLKRLKQRKLPNNRLLLVSCPADKQQVIQWKSEGIAVHNVEIILSGVLKQEIDETSYLL